MWTRKYITCRKICNTSRRQNRFTSLSSYTCRVQKNINFLHKLHIMYTEFYSVHFSRLHRPYYHIRNPHSTLKFFMYTVLFDGWVFLCGFFLLWYLCALPTPTTLSIYFFFFCCVPFKETMSRLGFALMKYETFYGKLCTKYIKKNFICMLCLRWELCVYVSIFSISERQFRLYTMFGKCRMFMNFITNSRSKYSIFYKLWLTHFMSLCWYYICLIYFKNYK